MRWCSEHGLPHSHLLGWDPVDRAKLTAFLLEEGDRCLMCGTSGWEWEADPDAYTAVAKVCMGCYRKEVESEEMGHRPGTRMTLIPRKVAEEIRARPVRRPTRRRDG